MKTNVSTNVLKWRGLLAISLTGCENHTAGGIIPPPPTHTVAYYLINPLIYVNITYVYYTVDKHLQKA